MKKIIKYILAFSMLMSICACSQQSSQTTTVKDDPSKKSSGVITYSEYLDAKVDDLVTVETYLQAKMDWWNDKTTIYTQDLDGAYFIYQMDCTQEQYEDLEIGQKLKITGYKSEWNGEIEIIDAKFEIEEGNYISEAYDVTELLGTDELVAHLNQRISFTDMKITKIARYGYDGKGMQGDDLYFSAKIHNQEYEFTVESDLCDRTTEVYEIVEGLKVGDKVDMEGFLYWYGQSMNPHITSVTVKS